jgi:hypothetical protein
MHTYLSVHVSRYYLRGKIDFAFNAAPKNDPKSCDRHFVATSEEDGATALALGGPS